MKRGSSSDRNNFAQANDPTSTNLMKVEILIVGGGIAGLATALALHRMGLESLVLEHSDCLRSGGTALTMWTNAWCALEALGVSAEVRKGTLLIDRIKLVDKNGKFQKELYLTDESKWRHEVRCVERSALLEALAKPLPSGMVRFNSRVVAIHKGPNASRTVVELEDGTFISTKVLIGCDGVHSVVAKWIGLPEPKAVGRYSIRGVTTCPKGHNLQTTFRQVIGEGIRVGTLATSATKIYWFITRSFPPKATENLSSSEGIRQAALALVQGFPQEIKDIIKEAKAETLTPSRIRVRWLWPVSMMGTRLTKGGATVAGDAMHAMEPDIGQGGCSALEDAVVLARAIAGAMKSSRVPKPGYGDNEAQEEDRHQQEDEEEDMVLIGAALEAYAKERSSRVFGLMAKAYLMARILETSSFFITWFRRVFLIPRMKVSTYLSHTQYECGPLPSCNMD